MFMEVASIEGWARNPHWCSILTTTAQAAAKCHAKSCSLVSCQGRVDFLVTFHSNIDDLHERQKR